MTANNPHYLEMRWRVGRQVGRTIYAHDGDDKGTLIGVMDTPELAASVVDCHNMLLMPAP